MELGDTVTTVSDLKGKTIYSTGKGAVPEYNLRYLLSQNGIDPDNDVNIVFKSEAAEIVAELSANGAGIAMLPQPFATVAGTKIEGLRTIASVSDEWAKVSDSTMITGVYVARKTFVEENPQAVEAFLTEYAASGAYVAENIDDSAALIEKYGIVNAAIAKKALPNCNLVCLVGDDMKTAVSSYLGVLYEQSPASVGGALPADDFYYGAN